MNVQSVLAELENIGALGMDEDEEYIEETEEDEETEDELDEDTPDDTMFVANTEIAELGRCFVEIARAAERAAHLVARLERHGVQVPKAVAATVQSVQTVAAPVMAAKPVVPQPENYEQLMASVRRRVLGQDLSAAELARAHGEAVPVEDDVPDSVPLGRLDFTPSWPSKENPS